MVVYSDTVACGILHNMWERMCTGCALEGGGGGGGNPGVSLPLHNMWERMYAGGGKSWGVPTST